MKLTCDRSSNLMRAALWQDGKLTDLYIDSLDKPDLSGATLRGKAMRVMAGGKAAWFDAGQDEQIYVESKGKISSGDVKILSVRSSMSQGKACKAVIVESSAGDVGVIEPPLNAWQRALADVQTKKVICSFTAQEDFDACQALAQKNVTLDPLVDTFPELDDRLDELRGRRVALNSGGEIVIDQTEALVAIDINAGTARNLTSVNLAAMHEIARQIRLRNLGGIIIIDALKMDARADKGKVLAALKRACANDPAGVEIFGITKLGLVEMTRTRRGLSLIDIQED